jgi:hypothetical protein
VEAAEQSAPQAEMQGVEEPDPVALEEHLKPAG